MKEQVWGGDRGWALLPFPTLRTLVQSPFPPQVLGCGVGCCDRSEAEGQRGQAGPGWVTCFWLSSYSSLLLPAAELLLEPNTEWDWRVNVPAPGAGLMEFIVQT